MHTFSEQRQTKSMWFYVSLFLFVALLLNGDRFILGKLGTLRHLDVADHYVQKFAFGGKFWQAPGDYAWQGESLRGWPTLLDSVNPLHLGCIFARFFPVEYAFPFLEVIIQFLILLGAFLFLCNVFDYDEKTALYGAFLYLVLYYWQNENPFVIQITLLPALCAFLAIGKNPLPLFLRLVVLSVVLLLSFPPYVLPLMSLAHFALLVFTDRLNRRRNIILAGLFWLIFSIFHYPEIIGYMHNWSQSNRALWDPHSKEILAFPQSFVYFLTYYNILPVCIFLALLTKKTVKPALVLLGLLIVVLVFVAFNQSVQGAQFFTYIPWLKLFSFFFVRLHNVVNLVLFLLGSLVMKEWLQRTSQGTMVKLIRWGALVCFLVVFMKLSSSHSVNLIHVMLAILLVGILLFDLLQKNKTIAIGFILCVIPFRLFYTLTEFPVYGNLYADRLTYENSIQPFRVVSVMDTFASTTFYPAQVSIRGHETLDGISVFYDRADAQRWLWFLKKGDSEQSKMFAYWNNRPELYYEDWEKNSDEVLRWLWLNNVEFIRSLTPLHHSGLKLEEIRSVKAWEGWKSFFSGSPKHQIHFLYRIQNPTTRIFSLSKELIGQKSFVDDYRSESNLLKRITPETRMNVALESYYPGRLSFRGEFDAKALIFVSSNYNKEWKLFIDGKPNRNRISRGPFGMIAVDPQAGMHLYSLVFRSPFAAMMVCCIGGFMLLLLLLLRIRKIEYFPSC